MNPYIAIVTCLDNCFTTYNVLQSSAHNDNGIEKNVQLGGGWGGRVRMAE